MLTAATHLNAADDVAIEEYDRSVPESLISRRLHEFFTEQGLPRHKHSSKLAAILGLSRSGAFRKFQDASFSASDLENLAQSFQVDVSRLLGGHAEQASTHTDQAARIVIGGRPIPCQATIGAELEPHEHSDLVATLNNHEWLVQPYTDASAGARHRVLKIVLMPEQRHLQRVAVLEDSADLAANLREAFEGSGFGVELFSSAAALAQRAALAPFDAYVVDWWLNGQTSAAILEFIRTAQPTVPLILTTGAIANGNAAEDEIVRISMAHRVQVIEKPFRLALLISQVKRLLDETH